MKTPLTRLLTSLILSAVFLSANTVAADNDGPKHCNHDHSGHSPQASATPKAPAEPVTAEQAAATAKVRMADLVKTQAIDTSWASIKPEGIMMTTRKHAPNQEQQWQVTFVNKSIKDPSRQTLHVFLGLDGSFRTTNYTGR